VSDDAEVQVEALPSGVLERGGRVQGAAPVEQVEVVVDLLGVVPELHDEPDLQPVVQQVVYRYRWSENVGPFRFP